MILLALALSGQPAPAAPAPVPEDIPPADGVTTTVETSGTAGATTTTETVGADGRTTTSTAGPAPGEVIGPPYGSRAGAYRDGEVWRPIEPPNYSGSQQVPSEAAVYSQANPELADGLKQKKAPPSGESPQRFALEIKFGPYLPDVDRNYTGPGFGPYATIFGETDADGVTTGAPRKGFYGGMAFEWQITKKLAGPIGIGVQWSMFRDAAQAPLADPPAEGSTRSPADRVRFSVMPIAVQAVYRFELLADKVRYFPFVPYVKAGVAYAFWWAKNGNGDIAVAKSGDRGRGGVWGWQLNLGAMLRLDFLERGTARRFDRTSGINHTYLFGEWQLTRLANFGRKNSMTVGDSTWMIGLAMEF